MILKAPNIKQILETLTTTSQSYPRYGELIEHIENLKRKAGNEIIVPIDITCLRLFMTASIDMWHRAINCFLISVAAKDNNDPWAGVSGYYSSHYVMRAFNYLFCELNSNIGVYELKQSKSGYYLHRKNKKRKQEHLYCWNVVFAKFKNPLFYACTQVDKNDQGHRNFASYMDHLNPLESVLNVDNHELSLRIGRISHITPTPPDKNFYPQLDNVQSMAFNRIIFYKNWMDQNIGPTTNYWSIHRDPKWCRGVMEYDANWPTLSDLVANAS